MKKIYSRLGIILIAVLMLVFTIDAKIKSTAKDAIYLETKDLPNAEIVLVLGAKVRANGFVSTILQDRLDTAIDVYQSGKVKKILVSGDHGQKEYDEVNAMKNYLLTKNIPGQDIFLDHAGFDTYDSLYRVKEIFGVKSLIISTQNFHLPRAIYIAKKLGLTVFGITADRHEYLYTSKIPFRDKLSQVKAFLDIIFTVKPKYLGERISIWGESQKSWD